MLSTSIRFSLGLGLVIACFLQLTLAQTTLAQVSNKTPANSIGFSGTTQRLNIDPTSNRTGTPFTPLEPLPNISTLNPGLLFYFAPVISNTDSVSQSPGNVYFPVGVPSRVFPGLIGLRKIGNTTPFSFSNYKQLAD